MVMVSVVVVVMVYQIVMAGSGGDHKVCHNG